MERNVYEVRWGDRRVSLGAGSTFLDAKKAFKWDRNVLMVDVDGDLQELLGEVKRDCSVKPLGFDHERARWALRHTAAHVLAQAVKKLFPSARLGIGPAIDDGFYYDFDTKSPFTPEDLVKIEKEMGRIVKADFPLVRREFSRDEALSAFKDEPYKLELIEDLPPGESISAYTQGEFTDLCAGPHVPSTGYVKAFKLLSVAGAYWKGDENLPVLQRIYGTAYLSQGEVDEHVQRLEEIKKRDHRKLARELDLFSIQEDGGPGLVYWHPKGAVIREEVEAFWRAEHRKRGYDLVYSPHIGKLDLWRKSGHWDWFREGMYPAMDVEGVPYMLKPMNCPFHVLIYKSHIRSYRDLPIRYGELGTVYRYERSGVLHGALRVRGFTQDDAHIFCRLDQMEDELVGVLELAQFMLQAFGYHEYECMLSVRGEDEKDKYIGEDDVWILAESALQAALERKGLPYKKDPGEAKFYGPAIDIKMKDAVGRLWQGPTIQVDLNQPERLDVNYVGEDGERHRVVMIHRTVLGSMERFIAGLVELHAGAFPLWLSPVQVSVIPVSEKQSAYAQEVKSRLIKEGLRVVADLGNEKMGYKIRAAQLDKVPYMLIVGGREEEAKTVSVRHRASGDLGSFDLEDFAGKIRREYEGKMPDSPLS